MSSTVSTPATTKRVVVVGAGSYGVWSANKLARMGFSVQLITKSDYTVFLPATVRVAIEEKFERTVIPLSEVVDGKVEIIKDEVTLMKEGAVELKGAGELKYDALVIATGSKWSAPFGTTHQFGDDYKDYYGKEHERIENAKHIVLIGGGFNNTEFAAELQYKYKDQLKDGSKKVTLVHSLDLLLPGTGRYHDTLRKRVTDYFQKETDVELILNNKAKIDEANPSHVIVGDRTIEGDLVYSSTGFVPSVPPHSFDNLTDEKGFIKVDNTWRCTGVSLGNVFAIGDVTNIPYKGIVLRGGWVGALGHNVEKVLNNPKVTKEQLKVSDPPKHHVPCIVSLGPERGYGQLGFSFLPWTLMLPQWLCVSQKSSDLMRNKSVKLLTEVL